MYNYASKINVSSVWDAMLDTNRLVRFCVWLCRSWHHSPNWCICISTMLRMVFVAAGWSGGLSRERVLKRLRHVEAESVRLSVFFFFKHFWMLFWHFLEAALFVAALKGMFYSSPFIRDMHTRLRPPSKWPYLIFWWLQPCFAGPCLCNPWRARCCYSRSTICASGTEDNINNNDKKQTTRTSP